MHRRQLLRVLASCYPIYNPCWSCLAIKIRKTRKAKQSRQDGIKVLQMLLTSGVSAGEGGGHENLQQSVAEDLQESVVISKLNYPSEVAVKSAASQANCVPIMLTPLQGM